MPCLADKEICNGCEACANACSHNSITFTMDEFGFYYPVVDEKKCVNCGLCEKKCPLISPSVEFRTIQYNDNIAYGAYMKNQKDIRQSASGGLALSIASYIFSKKGVVYGVVYANRFRDVVYAKCKNIEEFQPMRGSKYVMARKHEIYRDVRRELKNGTDVLFIGLPCEVGGLYAYLGRNVDNLYTVELICAGTGSYLAHQDFLDYLEDKEKSKIRSFTYRGKKRGWVPYYVSATYENGDSYSSDFSHSPLGSCIEKYKRSSCYHCYYKLEKRKADITIGDFWTLNPLHPIYNHWGTSVVFPRTNKGMQIMESLDNVVKCKVDIETAMRSNRLQLTGNAEIPIYRDEIEKVLLDEGIRGIELRYTPHLTRVQRIIEAIPGDIYKYIKKLGYWLKS